MSSTSCCMVAIHLLPALAIALVPMLLSRLDYDLWLTHYHKSTYICWMNVSIGWKGQCSLILRPLQDFISHLIFLHSCEIISGSGLGARVNTAIITSTITSWLSTFMRVQLAATKWVSITILLVQSTVIQCLKRGFTVCNSKNVYQPIQGFLRFTLLSMSLWCAWFRNLHTLSFFW